MLDYMKYWDSEKRLIAPNPLVPVYSQGNILEITGKIFIAMAIDAVPRDGEFIKMIADRYQEFWNEIKFMPRTVNPTMLPEMQPEVKDWKYCSELTTNSMGYYYQIATSTTQLCYLLMGLNLLGEPLCYDIMHQIVKDGWAIKCQGKVVENGAFIPFGLVAIQRYAIGKVIGKEPGFLSRIMLSTVGTWTRFPKNYIFWGKTQNEGEWFSTMMWLYWVKKLGESQHFDKWFPKYRDLLIKWREDRLAKTDEGDKLGNELGLAIITKIGG